MTTAPAFWWLIHRHNWNLIDKTVLPSGWEQLSGELEAARVSHMMFIKTLVLTFKCECGKVRIHNECSR